ncbi:PDR/VanB family oxidoreductase [Pseudonocardia oroxyli]|uniref:Ferredoxin-NADP reductase n=1 Tax=Pseudonocardia oroxyli TaxID=366584 RepID=A0A1G7DS98_PSEOR|nr:PDR/VanB family oxidoreductase [Pseudonocardia oroxyli]SDE54040.1 Ferredoxin-NADP reductase [Pseudonocardia oroxyli]
MTELVVSRTADPAPGIRELTLADPRGGPPPAAPPGAHVVLTCGDRRNAYSLVDTDPYVVAVRRQGAGSSWLHRLAPGDRVEVSGPRSTFAPVRTARRHLLVAGGIGVTPLLSHAREAVRWGQDVRMVYVHRRGAYAAELRALLGDRLREAGRADLERALDLTDQPLGTHLYVCGPPGLQDRVVDAAARAGWPGARIHRERFTAAPEPGVAFTARLRRTGRDLAVPEGTTLLGALEAAGLAVPSQCRQGVCGECRLPLLGGRPLHRDHYLAPEERAAAIMPCVSRAETLVELDL